MKKRSESRIKKSLLVDISKNGMQQMGVTVNISRRGMCIATTEVFRRNSKLQILIAAADDIYAVTGMVMWNRKKTDPSDEDSPAGIGIRIDKAAAEYYAYVSAIKKNSLPARQKRPVC